MDLYAQNLDDKFQQNQSTVNWLPAQQTYILGPKGPNHTSEIHCLSLSISLEANPKVDEI
jgi:hypothetical protein